MEYRQFGNTGLKVSRLGFGCMTFDTLDQTLELLEKARDYGCNFFDGAEAYGSPRGNCEKLFGEAYEILQKRDPIKWRRSDLVITTKLYFGPSKVTKGVPFGFFGENELGSSFKHIQEGIDGALKRCKLSYFDVVYSHRFDDVTPLIEQVRAYTKLINDGKCFYWGTSMWPPSKIIEAYWIAKVNNLIAPIVEQCQYSMFKRDYVEKEYLPIFDNRYNYATTIWGALDSGILTGKYLNGYPKGSRMHKDSRFASFYEKIPKWKHDKVRKLKDLAENKLNTNITSLAMAWCLKNENTTLIILGARNADQLTATFECYDLLKKLDDKIMKEIEDILDNKPVPDPGFSSWGRQKRNIRQRSML